MTDVELGRRSPTIDICRRICRGLGIELSAFFIALEADGYTALQDDGTSSE
jgi:transcriptional regulator with XRE-family HTH domain